MNLLIPGIPGIKLKHETLSSVTGLQQTTRPSKFAIKGNATVLARGPFSTMTPPICPCNIRENQGQLFKTLIN